MKKKNYVNLYALLIAAIFAFTLSGCAEKGDNAVSSIYKKKYKWKMVTSWPPDFPILGEGANMIAKSVEEMSGGQLKIKVYGAGELIPGFGVFDAVSEGTAEMGHSAAYYWSGKIPEAVFFTTIPFGLLGTQMDAWMLGGGGMEFWREAYSKYNVVPFMAGNTGVQMGGWFRKPVNSLNDVKGIKMRIPGLGGKVLASVGGSAISVAGGEIYTNLERGVIDATEWIGPFHDQIMGFDKVAKHYYYPGWHEPGTQFEAIVNQAAYEDLPAHLQKIVEAACLASHVWVRSQFEAKNAVQFQRIRDEGKINVHEFSPEVIAGLKKASEKLMQEQLKEHPSMQPIHDSYMKFKNDMVEWYKVTDGNFLDWNK